VKSLIFGGGFFILLAERGVVPKEGCAEGGVADGKCKAAIFSFFIRIPLPSFCLFNRFA
jgi:hypothetical protein